MRAASARPGWLRHRQRLCEGGRRHGHDSDHGSPYCHVARPPASPTRDSAAPTSVFWHAKRLAMTASVLPAASAVTFRPFGGTRSLPGGFVTEAARAVASPVLAAIVLSACNTCTISCSRLTGPVSPP